MRYFTIDDGSYWFQMRVPAALRPRYGEMIRVNLQTQERSVARQLGLRLAAELLTRFSLNLAREEFELPPSASLTAPA